MKEMEFNEFVTRINALSDEQKVITVSLMPDEVLWAELYTRYTRRNIILENVKGVLNSPPQDESTPN